MFPAERPGRMYFQRRWPEARCRRRRPPGAVRWRGTSATRSSFAYAIHRLAGEPAHFPQRRDHDEGASTLITEGRRIDEEALARLSPYQTEHINRFGRYALKRDRAPEPPDRVKVLRMPPQSEETGAWPRMCLGHHGAQILSSHCGASRRNSLTLNVYTRSHPAFSAQRR
jgi:hypothetical protein